MMRVVVVIMMVTMMSVILGRGKSISKAKRHETY